MGRLYYTGHALIDAGVAALCAYMGTLSPEDVTDEHLTQFSHYLRLLQTNQVFNNKVLSIAFTKNAAFTANMGDDKRSLALDEILMSWQHDTFVEGRDTLACVFFPEYRSILSADRRHLPLMNAQNTINFTPMGNGGIPVCGLALLMLSAMALNAYQIGGKLLVFHQIGADTNLNSLIAREIWHFNHLLLTASLTDDVQEWTSPYSHPQTAYVDSIVHARKIANENGFSNSLANITAYYFSNSGQGAHLEILRLDNHLLSFLDAIMRRASSTWLFLVESTWQRSEDDARGRGHNQLYTLLFQLPQQTPRFIKLLMRAHNWQVIALFLEKGLQMEQHDIDIIRDMGDRLAEYALTYENNPTAFYYRISRAKSFDDLRHHLRNAGEHLLKASQQAKVQPLFTFDEFVTVFTSDVPYFSWKLSRDLITFRMLEILTQRGGLDIDDLPEDALE